MKTQITTGNQTVEFKPYQINDDTFGISIMINGVECCYILWVDICNGSQGRIVKTNRKGFGWKGSKSQAESACEILSKDYFNGEVA